MASPLFSLPAELRDLVLQHVLCESHLVEFYAQPQWVPVQEFCELYRAAKSKSPQNVDRLRRYRCTRWAHGRPSLDILATCRQLYAEGSDLLFRNTKFVVTGFVDVLRDRTAGSNEFLGSLPLHETLANFPQMAMIRKLSVNLNVSEYNLSGTSWWEDGWVQDAPINRPFSNIPYYLARHCGRFQELSVSCNGPPQWLDHPGLDLRAKLYRFGCLRADRVTFEGIDCDKVQPLIRVMQSHLPLIDLSHVLFRIIHFLVDVLDLQSTLRRATKAVAELGDNLLDGQPLAATLIDAMLDWDMTKFRDVAERCLKTKTSQIQSVQDAINEMPDVEKLIAEGSVGRVILRAHRGLGWFQRTLDDARAESERLNRDVQERISLYLGGEDCDPERFALFQREMETTFDDQFNKGRKWNRSWYRTSLFNEIMDSSYLQKLDQLAWCGLHES